DVYKRQKQAVLKRVFGFEIIPAPLVIAHLQVGLVMQDLGAPLNDEKEERANIILTNALTRLDPSDEETPLISRIPELRDERERADDVKQQKPILVILGNPPYDGFAGVAANKEERELTKPYRVVRHAPPPTGRAKWRGLKDLYVRFFRMAERRIAEKTEEGVICFISNYSWLDGISFPGMRERYLDVFDIIRIDCLNGDKFKTGKTTSDGSPDPSIFSTESDPVGIQVGTAITTLIRKKEHKPTDTIGLRNLWGQTKRQQLLESSETPASALYKDAQPVPSQGSPFIHTTVSDGWAAWPSLPDLFSTVFFGVQTNHDSFLVDIDLKELKDRVADYFNPGLNNETIAQRHSSCLLYTS
ncbi:MAG: DNA methyltransferase, partial [Alphaproteobacteria bacterium]|nr:DNA methyltransferase [Alphaproteobacteria bacterium]